MPRGIHPNSLANLKKGKATQFGADGDSRAKEAQAKGKLSQTERKCIAEEMKALLDTPNNDGSTKRKVLAAKLVMNMDKSPEWYKLGLRILGELPAENVKVSTGDFSALDKAMEVLNASINKDSGAP